MCSNTVMRKEQLPNVKRYIEWMLQQRANNEADTTVAVSNDTTMLASQAARPPRPATATTELKAINIPIQHAAQHQRESDAASQKCL